jgi:hypothetical protein
MSKKKQIGRNLTVYLPDTIVSKMEGLREVNWSQVCQEAIERYVDARKSLNPTVRLRLDQLKQDEYKAGYIFGSQLASDILDKLNFQEVHDLRWNWLDEEEENWWYDNPSLITDWLGDEVDGERYASDEERKKWHKRFDEQGSKKGSIYWVLKLAENKKGFRKNSMFFDGTIKALREILA